MAKMSQVRRPEQARDVQLYDIIADPQVETDEYYRISNPTSIFYGKLFYVNMKKANL